MDSLIGLASLAGLSLFLARLLRRSASLMPIVALSAGMLWFTAFGCVGLLQLGGWLWYAGCAAAVGYVVYKERAAVLRRITPGWVFFTAGGVLFVLLFFFTQPMLVQWDEFTFWGAAGRVVTDANQLYTTAHSNLVARSYPPGLVMLSYLMQFFGGGFAEWKFIAAFALVYLAAFAAASTMWDKHRGAAVLALGALFLLPLLFEVNSPPGQFSWAYLSCMADWPMAAMFGGALCVYFGGAGPKDAPARDGRLLLAFGLVLAALTNMKDMGLALAMIAWFIALVDMVLFQRDEVSFFGLRRWKGVFAGAGCGLALIVGTYAGWLLHLQAALQVDRFNVGPGGSSLSQFGMLIAGVKALFGIERSQQFDVVSKLMWDALFNKNVWLLGSGFRLMLIIFVLLGIAWMLSGTKKQRRRILVFTGVSTLCFAAFYIFNIFTYSYVIHEVEAFILKDYNRYIGPYWFGWMMAAIGFLAEAAIQTSEAKPKRAEVRGLAARAAMAGLCVCLVLVVGCYGSWGGNFLTVSPAMYGTRLSVRAVVNSARGEGMRDEDVVYILSQGDNGTRFYMFGYEMKADLSMGLGVLPVGSVPEINPETGLALLPKTTASTLVPLGTESSEYLFPVPATAEELGEFLRQQGCTHVIVDIGDNYLMEEFAPKFSDGLAGWNPDGGYAGGKRYYEIEWKGEEYSFVSAEGGGEA